MSAARYAAGGIIPGIPGGGPQVNVTIHDHELMLHPGTDEGVPMSFAKRQDQR